MLERAKAVIGRDPYANSLETRNIENSLIALPSAKFVFAGIGTGINELVAHVVDSWDTGYSFQRYPQR